MNSATAPEPEASSAGAAQPTPVVPDVTTAEATAQTTALASRPLWPMLAIALAVAALVGNVLLWQKLSNIQEQLARQSAEAIKQSTEARTLAEEARDLVRDTSARMALSETRLNEVALQRSQLEDLMQSLSRSRDENLVVDIDASLRLAQQQAQLAGSVEPLLASLKSAEQRVNRASQPRLVPLQRALTRDIARVKAATVSDTSALLSRLDELVRFADELPLANAVAVTSGQAPAALKTERNIKGQPESAARATHPNLVLEWAWRAWEVVLSEARGLVRVSSIATPEAALLTPEQSFFVRENLKLKLLNARLGLLARQLDASRADLAAATQMVNRYFDASARRTQSTVALLQQVQQQMKTLELPRVDDTLAALATAASGH